MRIEEGSLSSFADSQNCLNGAQYKARFTGYADCFNPSSKHNWDVPKTSFTCWFGGVQMVELPDEDNDSMWNASPTPKTFLSNADMPRIAYPIAQELPYIQLPIGRNGTGKLEVTKWIKDRYSMMSRYDRIIWMYVCDEVRDDAFSAIG
jgi:hypothetical protein